MSPSETCQPLSINIFAGHLKKQNIVICEICGETTIQTSSDRIRLGKWPKLVSTDEKIFDV